MSKPAISKHLKVLEETGVVRREVVGRTHRLSLAPDVLSEAADWMDQQRALWSGLFDAVDEYLNRTYSARRRRADQQTPRASSPPSRTPTRLLP